MIDPRFVLRVARRKRARRALPPRAPGEVCAAPDFVGIGVQRCGSTWWDRLVQAHPGVHRASGRDKELHYFDGFAARRFTPADAAGYARYFPRPPGLLAGEWTPRYLYDVWTLPLLLEAAPTARLLVILRDPVERFVSGLTRHASWRGALRPATVQQAFERGLYAAQLDRLFHLVEPSRVLVLQFERCRDDPRGELARTYRFLGLSDGHRPDLTHRPGTRPPRAPVDEQLRATLRAAYAPDLARLPGLVPDLDLDRWASASSRG